MAKSSPVTVYNLRVFDQADTGWIQAPFKATRDAIDGLGGSVLEGTGEDIDPELLDGDGRFVRVPTGWGDLD